MFFTNYADFKVYFCSLKVRKVNVFKLITSKPSAASARFNRTFKELRIVEKRSFSASRQFFVSDVTDNCEV